MTNTFTKNILPELHNKFLWFFIFTLFLTFSLSYGETLKTLEVGKSGQSAPYSFKTSDYSQEGFDVAIAKRNANDKKLSTEWIASQQLDSTDTRGRDNFGIERSDVTISPNYSIASEFSIPVSTMEAYFIIDAKCGID